MHHKFSEGSPSTGIYIKGPGVGLHGSGLGVNMRKGDLTHQNPVFCFCGQLTDKHLHHPVKPHDFTKYNYYVKFPRL